MKKLGILFKEASQNRIKNYLKDSSAVIILRYSGLSSPDLSSLRQNLRNSNASLFVVKNSVACRALASVGLEPLVKMIQGPCGMVFVKEEPVATSKVLCGFSKDHEQLKLEGGILNDKFLEVKDIEFMSKLPSREALRAQVVMTLNAPISGLVFALNQILSKLVYCLDQIQQKKKEK
ncbi:MAG: 50S ribosomal protein L10 [Candidatus Omnitrophota bacterium]